MYKLVGFDLDGTLLNDKGILDDISLNMLRNIKKEEVDILIVTGRSYFSAAKYFKNFDFNISIISNNGNLTRSLKDDSLIDINPIDIKDVLKIYKLVDGGNIYPLVHINGFDDGYDIATIVKDTSNHVKRYPHGFGNRALYLKDFNLLDYDVLSIVFAGEYDDLVYYKKLLDNKISAEFNIHLSYVRSKNLYILEVLQKSGDKYYGVKRYIESNDIIFNEIIFVGDDTNDLLLIENAGIGIGMCNGNELVKRKADFITQYSNNDNGALREVLKILRG